MSKLTFWLNGQETTIDQPSTGTMLIDYLRSPQVGLSGPKKPCGQGGCGGCTVILSDWDTHADKPRHRAINSCLHPLVALNGLVVTTVEGTGSTKAAAPRFLSHVPSYQRSGMPAEEEQLPAVAQAQEAAAAKNEARVQEAAVCGGRAGMGGGSPSRASPSAAHRTRRRKTPPPKLGEGLTAVARNEQKAGRGRGPRGNAPNAREPRSERLGRHRTTRSPVHALAT